MDFDNGNIFLSIPCFVRTRKLFLKVEREQMKLILTGICILILYLRTGVGVWVHKQEEEDEEEDVTGQLSLT